MVTWNGDQCLLFEVRDVFLFEVASNGRIAGLKEYLMCISAAVA